MSENQKETNRIPISASNKENRNFSQNKIQKRTGINEQRRTKVSDKSISATSNKNHGMTMKNAQVPDGRNGTESGQNKDIKLQVLKWRAERNARLASRITKKTQGNVEVPPVILGLSVCNSSFGVTVGTTSATCISNGNKQLHGHRDVKSTVKAKRKIIEVRQTTASRLRMEKANPLLTMVNSTVLATTNKLKTPLASAVKSTNFSRKQPAAAQKQLFKVPKCDEVKIANKARNNVKMRGEKLEQKCNKNVKQAAKTFAGVRKIKRNTITENGISRIPRSGQKATQQSSRNTRQNESKISERASLRRSSSATGLSRMNSLLRNSVMTTSVPDIPRACNDYQQSGKKVRQSRHIDCQRVVATPLRKPQVKTPLPTLFTPQPDVLRKRLINWLEKRGKSLNTFHHIRCFGLHNATSMENNALNRPEAALDLQSSDIKSKIEAPETNNDSFDSYRQCVEPHKNILSQCNVDDLKNILSDLHKLVLAAYPRDQCEEWLHLIRRQFPNLDDEPFYWECLAALEEARGDYSTAIDFYSRAIVSGAEADVIDKSLDLLWQKFTSLNLCPGREELDSKKQKTPKRVINPCQVFKSSIIKFALQQRAVKQLSANLGVEPKALHYVATPVRRSTRQSNNPFKSSSGIVCVGSLNTLREDVRKSVVFVSNNALTPKI